MSPKAPSEFSVDEVCMWVTAIGLGASIDEFKENAIDGGMLVTLQDADLQGDLGLTHLQIRKFHQSLEFSTSLAATGGAPAAPAGGGHDESGRVAALEQENSRLRTKCADLQAIIDSLQQGQPQQYRAPAPAPQYQQPPPQQYQQPPPQQYQQPPPQQYQQPPPQQYQQPPPQQYQQQGYHEEYPQEYRQGHPVVAGAAGGAARGALLGAIGGAIVGDPGMGAKMGAAMGAAGGGMGGLAARRRARRMDGW